MRSIPFSISVSALIIKLFDHHHVMLLTSYQSNQLYSSEAIDYITHSFRYKMFALSPPYLSQSVI